MPFKQIHFPSHKHGIQGASRPISRKIDKKLLNYIHQFVFHCAYPTPQSYNYLTHQCKNKSGFSKAIDMT